MDVLLIYMILVSIVPFLLWNRNLHKATIFQIPFLFGMWIAFGIHHFGNGVPISDLFIWVLFYGNLIYGHIGLFFLIIRAKNSSEKTQSVSI